MFKLTKKMITTGLISIFAFTVIFANVASNATPLAMSAVLQKLNSAGYFSISQVKWDGNAYQSKAVNAVGQWVKLSVKSDGTVVLPTVFSPSISMLTAAKNVEAKGYSNITQIQYKSTYYDVDAYDVNNNKIDLHVNAATGDVTSSN